MEMNPAIDLILPIFIGVYGIFIGIVFLNFIDYQSLDHSGYYYFALIGPFVMIAIGCACIFYVIIPFREIFSTKTKGDSK